MLEYVKPNTVIQNDFGSCKLDMHLVHLVAMVDQSGENFIEFSISVVSDGHSTHDSLVGYRANSSPKAAKI